VWRPAGLVILALSVGAIMPAVLDWYQGRISNELRQIFDPARSLVEASRVALERSISTQAEYHLSGNDALRRRSADWSQRWRDVLARLSALSSKLGPDAQRELSLLLERVAEFRRAEQEHEAAQPTRADEFRAIPAMEARVESMLATHDALQAALDREVRGRADQLMALERASWLGTVVLAVIGLGAVVEVTRLTRREQRARAAAEAAVRTRDEVVSIVSHDLRSPLNTVQLAAASLLGGLPEAPDRALERRQLQMIQRAAGKMNRMIEDLLDIARIESGGLEVTPARIAVAPLVEEAAATLQPIAEAQGQLFESHVDDEVPDVLADHDRVLQILSNLVGNAVKFTPRGGTITLTAGRDPAGVRFGVADTGCGMPADHIPHLFDRFWQATKTDRRGIGLGLPIVKALVEAHGGHLAVESRVGKGTIFTFTLSAADRPPAPTM
jgi:signal transduction histidine kinase